MNKIDYLSKILTDELTDIREKARENKDYLLSDEIRNELDSRGCFVMDSPTGQVIYHLGPGYSRKYLIDNISNIDNNFKYRK